MRSQEEIQKEIEELEEEQSELEFGSVGYDFINADLIGLYGELSKSQAHWDRLKLTGMLGVKTEC